MINDTNFAFGLALLSMALVVGWFALKQKKTGDLTWQKFFEQWPGHIAQFFYFVGIPYLAIILGQITPGLLGLKGVEHIALINWNSQFVAGQLQQAVALVRYRQGITAHRFSVRGRYPGVGLQVPYE